MGQVLLLLLKMMMMMMTMLIFAAYNVTDRKATKICYYQ